MSHLDNFSRLQEFFKHGTLLRMKEPYPFYILEKNDLIFVVTELQFEKYFHFYYFDALTKNKLQEIKFSAYSNWASDIQYYFERILQK
jgi:hypothetical protein